jgi:hypothetical protein
MLHNEELHNLYASPNIISEPIKKDEIGGEIACMGAIRNVYKISVRNPEGKRSLGRPRHRCKD